MRMAPAGSIHQAILAPSELVRRAKPFSPRSFRSEEWCGSERLGWTVSKVLAVLVEHPTCWAEVTHSVTCEGWSVLLGFATSALGGIQ